MPRPPKADIGSSYVIHLARRFLLLFVVLAEAGDGAHVVVVFTLGAGLVCGIFVGVSLDVLCGQLVPPLPLGDQNTYPSP